MMAETKKQIKNMCNKKRQLKQGIDGKPTRIMLDKKIIKNISKCITVEKPLSYV